MATVCPWQPTTTLTPIATQQPASPSLQEIMDEELAKRLQEEEELQLIRAADWQFVENDTSSDEELVDDEFEDKEPVPAEQQDAVDYGEEDALDLGDDDDLEYTGKGFNSYRECLRRRDKQDSHRAPPSLDLAKNGVCVRASLFDERTQAVLQKLANKRVITSVRSRIHTGRHANLYHGAGVDSVTGSEREMALKVFKTSKGDLRKFNELDESGRRYDLDFVKKSIRRQLKIRAEREYKRMSRAYAALPPEAIMETDEKSLSAGRRARAPKPFVLRGHVLISEFVGTNDHPAVALADAALTPLQLRNAYINILRAIRRLYQRARLVHGQLSPSSILYHGDECWIMGLGHAVEVNSENDMVLLTSDLDSLDAYFRARGVRVASKRSVGLLDVATARDYVVSESPETLLKRFSAMEWLLRDC